MEQLLKPERLNLDLQAAGASNTFDHWLQCFEDYIEASTAVRTDADKLRVLHGRVSDVVYSTIRDMENYTAAIELLKRQYNKRPNEVYARHLLATRRRQPGESVDQFLRALRLLAQNCNCETVTATQYTEDLIWDAFVTGIGTTYIRQRLLEQGALDLKKTVELAESLEVTSQYLEAYSPDHVGASWTPQPSLPGGPQTYAGPRLTGDLTTAAASEGPKCYFCGLGKHPRQRCPMRELFCSACGKKGHYAKACRKSTSKSTSTACDPRGPPSWMTPATCDSRGPPSWTTPAACDPRGPPSLMMSSAAGDLRGLPSWTTSATSDQQGPSSPTSSAPYGYLQDSTVASVTLDQTKPHRLAKSMMDIELA
ncbi:uncharacterized protein LOC144497028 [Mustelus asterias]